VIILKVHCNISLLPARDCCEWSHAVPAFVPNDLHVIVANGHMQFLYLFVIVLAFARSIAFRLQIE